MNSNKEGSGLLIIIILMSGLMLYLLTIWQATAYLANISLLREQYEKEYSTTLGLMNWTIALAKINFNVLNKATQTKFTLKWPPDNKLYDAIIEITAVDANSISLCVKIDHDQQSNCILKANLLRQEIAEEGDVPQYQFAISDWSHETN